MSYKSSILWKVSKEELCSIIERSNSIREVLLHYGLRHAGNYKTLYRRCSQDRIDIQHLKDKSKQIRKNGLLNQAFVLQYTNDDVFVENSEYNRGNLKSRIIKDELLEYKCEKCGLKDQWQNEKIVLVLDHINGINNDNRIENLRFLCPNCNSQTATFAGRKRLRCVECNRVITRYSKTGLCKGCINKKRVHPTKCPSKEELLELLKSNSKVNIGKKFGVSGTTVKKWERKLGISN